MEQKELAPKKTANGGAKKGMGRAERLQRRNQGFQVVGMSIAQTPRVRNRGPVMSSQGDGIVVTNREILLSVVGTATAGSIPAGAAMSKFEFGAAGGLAATWANNLAVAYDKYRLISLKLEWQPTLPTTSSGAVAIYFDPDPEIAVPAAGYVAVSGNQNNASGSIFQALKVVCKKDQLNRLPWYMTTNGTASPSSFVNACAGTSVIGWSQITLANAAAAGTTALGYLWAEYTIRFENPSKST